MRILHIISLVLCLSSIHGYPTRPLDDLDRNLTWVEAWDGDEMTRKKVVPKSVFIAPDFGSAQKCPAGHERDSRGNCIKLHSLDADSQLNFLFEKILAGLPPSDGDMPGPVRLNVPFDHTEPVDEIEDEIAVVVSPTNGSFSPENMSLHKDDEQPDAGEVTITTELDTTTTTMSTITTIQEETDTLPTTTLYTTDQTTTTDTTTYPTTITTYPPTTTTTDISTTEISSQPVTDITFTITSRSGDETGTVATTTEIFNDKEEGEIVVEPQAIFFRMPEITEDLDTTTRREHSTNYVSSNIVFPEHVKQSNNFVSFPEETNRKRPQRHGNFEGDSPELFYFSHRNRDKNLWRFNNFDRKIQSAGTTQEKSSQLFKQLEQLSNILNKRKSR